MACDFVLGSPPTPSDVDVAEKSPSLWSVSSPWATQTRFFGRPELVPVPTLSPAPPPRRQVALGTGGSAVSGVTGYSTTPRKFEGSAGVYVGGKKDWGSKNPFK